MGAREWTTICLVGVVCGLWITSSLHSIPVALASVSGTCVLLLCGILKWRDAVRQHVVWDIMIWYGGVITLGRALSDAGVPSAITTTIGATLGDLPWLPMLAIALPIYFFAHYGLASITMHFLTLFPVFLLLLLDQGAPLGLTVYLLTCLANLSGWADPLRHSAVAHLLLPGLRHFRAMVDCRNCGRGLERSRVVLGRQPVVEADRNLVASVPSDCATL